MKKIFLFLGLLMGFQVGAQTNLITNGEFDIDSPFCFDVPTGWIGVGANPAVQQTYNDAHTDMWVDMTSCDWGNLRGLQQSVPTVSGKDYELSFDLGCWVDERHTTGGVELYVNNQFYAHFNYEDFTGSPVKWKRFTTCIHATSSSTTLRFVAQARKTVNTPAWVDLNSTTAGARVVALDKVSMVLKGNTDVNPELITNGKFDVLQVPFCDGVPNGWASAGSVYGVQWVDNGHWMDLTGCDFRNGRGIAQTVATEIGEAYRLQYSIGSYSTYNARAMLYVNSVPVDSPLVYKGVAPVSFSTFYYDFVATTDSTTIKFMAASINPDSAQVVGLDNVTLRKKLCGGEAIEMTSKEGSTKPAPVGAVINKDIAIVPNPIESGTSNVRLNLNLNMPCQIEVIIADYMGRQYVNQRFDIRDGGEQTLVVELGKANLAPGIYLLRVNGLDKTASQVLIVK